MTTVLYCVLQDENAFILEKFIKKYKMYSIT